MKCLAIDDLNLFNSSNWKDLGPTIDFLRNLGMAPISWSVCSWQLSLMFVGNARSLPQNGATERFFTWVSSGYHFYYSLVQYLRVRSERVWHHTQSQSIVTKTAFKNLTRTNTLAYFAPPSVIECSEVSQLVLNTAGYFVQA